MKNFKFTILPPASLKEGKKGGKFSIPETLPQAATVSEI
jgi:hypothetical protein